MKRILLLLIALLSPGAVWAQPNYVDAYRTAVQRVAEGDIAEGLRYARLSDSLRPHHPMLMLFLAKAFADNNLPDDAIATLQKRAGFYAEDDFSEDPGLKSLSNHPGYFNLMDQVHTLTSPVRHSTKEFAVPADSLHAEGIAYDPVGKIFWISDVRKGRLIAFDPEHRHIAAEIDLSGQGYWSVLGVAVDPGDPKKLWATTAALPQFEGYQSKLEGMAALLEMDGTTGRIVKAHTLEGDHLWGDLHFSPSGVLYLSDSIENRIYVLNADGHLEALPVQGPFWSLQGMAASADGRFLYVSDYVSGVYRVDLATFSARPVLPDNAVTKGTDGLYLEGSTMVMLQNGTVPKRVSRLQLDGQGLGRPGSWIATDQGLPDLDEPTLGVRVDGKLFYIANSPWGLYRGDGKPVGGRWPAIEVWSIPMK